MTNTNTSTVTASDGKRGAGSARRSSTENMKVRGEALSAKVKGLIHEANVRRIVVKNDDGHTIIEIPVSAGVIAVAVAPVLTAVAAIAALASDWEVEVHREDDRPAGT